MAEYSQAFDEKAAAGQVLQVTLEGGSTLPITAIGRPPDCLQPFNGLPHLDIHVVLFQEQASVPNGENCIGHCICANGDHVDALELSHLQQRQRRTTKKSAG
jgi:hypothetical protein